MLNKKPAHQHQPIYIPKKKKKVLKKLLLSLIITLIVVILVVLIINVINLKKTGNVQKDSSIEENILNEMRLNALLKEDILNTEGIVWWEDSNFPSQVKEKIQDMTPYFMECVAKICENPDSCVLTIGETESLNLSGEEVYPDFISISSFNAEIEKIFTIFCWGVEQSVNNLIYEEENIIQQFCGNGIIGGSEQCDGSNLNGKTCEHFGYVFGTLSCEQDCNFNFSKCSGCVLEKNSTFCTKYGKDCGIFSGTDNCKQIRTVNCGTCVAPETCGGGGVSNVCAEGICIPETDQTFCSRFGKDCGILSMGDNCGESRTVNCGTCVAPETCGGGGVANVCDVGVCVPETNQIFCSRYGKDCGTFSGTDNCGQTRIISCGTCVAPETCGGGGVTNVCDEGICVPETDQTFCSRYGRACGVLSRIDNCGGARTVNCGSCAAINQIPQFDMMYSYQETGKFYSPFFFKGALFLKEDLEHYTTADFQKSINEIAENNYGNVVRMILWYVTNDPDVNDEVIDMPHPKVNGRYNLHQINYVWWNKVKERVKYCAERNITVALILNHQGTIRNWNYQWLNPNNNWGWNGVSTYDDKESWTYWVYIDDDSSLTATEYAQYAATRDYLLFMYDFILTELAPYKEFIIIDNNEIDAEAIVTWHDEMANIVEGYGYWKDRRMTSVIHEWLLLDSPSIRNRWNLQIHSVFTMDDYLAKQAYLSGINFIPCGDGGGESWWTHAGPQGIAEILWKSLTDGNPGYIGNTEGEWDQMDYTVATAMRDKFVEWIQQNPT